MARDSLRVYLFAFFQYSSIPLQYTVFYRSGETILYSIDQVGESTRHMPTSFQLFFSNFIGE